MQIHNLKRVHPNKKSKTVGRGGTRGKTAGRGTKGQNARAGGGNAYFEGGQTPIHIRFPKIGHNNSYPPYITH